ncbi:hypothetical protein QJS10_CPA06g01502 [Acorus calamus]|uniref:Uncharacterized protein n=1 Tax=Acorus calamus TaxID=4465 RepID=A0AAV9EM22_ACOCL|nr:hypothetical protein QJS10_CPA06g01502 [Acorus calamus]
MALSEASRGAGGEGDVGDSEYDSDTSLFLHKPSCKLFEGLAKLNLSFQNNPEGRIFSPQMGFLTKHLSVLYDLERANSLVKGSFDVIRALQFKFTHDVKDEEIPFIPSISLPSLHSRGGSVLLTN